MSMNVNLTHAAMVVPVITCRISFHVPVRVDTQGPYVNKVGKYSDDSFIRTRLFPVDISGLTGFPDY